MPSEMNAVKSVITVMAAVSLKSITICLTSWQWCSVQLSNFRQRISSWNHAVCYASRLEHCFQHQHSIQQSALYQFECTLAWNDVLAVLSMQHLRLALYWAPLLARCASACAHTSCILISCIFKVSLDIELRKVHHSAHECTHYSPVLPFAPQNVSEHDKLIWILHIITISLQAHHAVLQLIIVLSLRSHHALCAISLGID